VAKRTLPTANLPTAKDGRSAFAVAEAAVREAGAVIMERLPEMTRPLSQRTVIVTNKDSWNNLVTDVDRAAEAALIGALDAAFPDHAVLAEESGARDGAGTYRWWIDPLDGTRNFAAGISQIAVNLALTDGDDLVLGLTYDPVRNELFHATLGGGAWLDDEPIAVSEVATLKESIMGFDMGYSGAKGELLLDMIKLLWPGMQSVRMMGSAALGVAYAAAGRFQIYAHHYVQPWDIAAGLLIVHEAGGIATDLRGDPAVPDSGCIVAASPAIHEAFMRATDGTAWRLSQGKPNV
jgi:myo-inositol-1(or 4)-monophosphatase